MALINHAKKEINAKIIVFGPTASGKSTVINGVYRKLKAECRGKLKSMAVQNDRMLFFDFTPPGQEGLDGYTVRFHLYSLTGEVTSPSSWKMVVKGADGVLFLADSRTECLGDNERSLEQLEEYLGTSFATVPRVILYNKRDLPTALPLPDLEEVLNRDRVPAISAVASRGEGLLDGLSRLIRLIAGNLKKTGLELGSGVETISRQEEIPSADYSAGTAVSHAGTAQPDRKEIEPPRISISGKPECGADGELLIPLTLKDGAIEKKITIAVKVILDDA